MCEKLSRCPTCPPSFFFESYLVSVLFCSSSLQEGFHALCKLLFSFVVPLLISIWSPPTFSVPRPPPPPPNPCSSRGKEGGGVSFSYSFFFFAFTLKFTGSPDRAGSSSSKILVVLGEKTSFFGTYSEHVTAINGDPIF